MAIDIWRHVARWKRTPRPAAERGEQERVESRAVRWWRWIRRRWGSPTDARSVGLRGGWPVMFGDTWHAGSVPHGLRPRGENRRELRVEQERRKDGRGLFRPHPSPLPQRRGFCLAEVVPRERGMRPWDRLSVCAAHRDDATARQAGFVVDLLGGGLGLAVQRANLGTTTCVCDSGLRIYRTRACEFTLARVKVP